MPDSLEILRRRLDGGETLTLAGLGDSLTYGWMVERGFFDRFVDALEGAYPRTQLHRVHAGVPGSTADQGLRRLSRLLERRPDLVTVQFGLNDCYQALSVESFAGRLETIARQITEAGSVAWLLTSCPVQDSGLQKMVEPFYAAIASVGDRLSAPVAQLDRYWLAHVGDRRPQELYLSDGVHPSDAGHALMAEGLLAGLGAIGNP